MPSAFTESAYENALIQLFQSMGYRHLYGPDIDRDYEDTRHTRFGTLSSHNYPPEGMEEALRTVMMQCEL